MLKDFVCATTYQAVAFTRTRRSRGRWIVVVLVPNTRIVVHGYRYQSKAEAKRHARRENASGALRAIVRRFHRKQWKPSARWTAWAEMSTTVWWLKPPGGDPTKEAAP